MCRGEVGIPGARGDSGVLGERGALNLGESGVLGFGLAER